MLAWILCVVHLLYHKASKGVVSGMKRQDWDIDMLYTSMYQQSMFDVQPEGRIATL